jgi:hypothetical protein
MAPRHATGRCLSGTRVALQLAVTLALAFVAGCPPEDGIRGDDGLPVGSQPDADPSAPDAMPMIDGMTPAAPCDMTGRWIAEIHTVSTASIGGDQLTTNWFYFQISQTGDRFTLDKALHCGFVVSGTTSVALGDATTEALAANEYAGPGRQGTFKPTADNSRCEFSMDRMYNIRGANKAMYLTSLWNVGDPPKALTTFPQLPKVTPGIEDWDGDGMHGITLTTGLGPRYVAQRDWNEHLGTVAQFATEFGGETGEGKLTVKWDSQEAVSDQTSPILRITASPKGDGWSRFARADGRLTVVESGERADLRTCRNVQQLARDIW